MEAPEAEVIPVGRDGGAAERGKARRRKARASPGILKGFESR